MIPIALTNVAWQNYIKFVQDALGESPTRGLDKAGIDLKSASAFLHTLSLDNSVEIHDHTLNHIYVSFMGKVRLKVISDFAKYTNLKILFHKCPDDDYLLILSGTLTEWKEALVGCKTDYPPHYRKELTSCYQSLRQHFPIFTNLRERILPDNTIILE